MQYDSTMTTPLADCRHTPPQGANQPTSVLILGAGGLGREVFWWAKDAGMRPIGFIDDNPHALDAYADYAPIIGTVTTAPLSAPILCAIGQNPIRKRCVEQLKQRGATFTSCIHPQAKVYHSALGEGAIVAPYAYIGADVTVGDFLFIQTGAVLGHDVLAGNFLRMDTTSFIGGFAHIGDNVTLHTGAKVMPTKHVASDVTLGAGAVLINNLSHAATVFGIPAQKI